MKTKILKMGEENIGPEPLAMISEILDNDGVMAYPTETFYGLGVLALSEKAIEKVYRLKERERGKPLSVIIADLAMAEKIAVSLPPLFRPLAREFWPGPLTLVVRAKPLFPSSMLGRDRSLAMRVPAVSWLRALVRHLGVPITATSANISGQREISTSDDVIAAFQGAVDLIIDGGRTPGGRPSTIVDLAGTRPLILRVGAVPASALRKYLS
jgi:L-threonylcarbamoyladenylate synthase